MDANNRVYLDASSTQDILAALDELIGRFSDIDEVTYFRPGLEFHDRSTGMPLALETPIHPQVPSFSELAFYMIAAENRECLPGIEEITRIAIRKNRTKPVWINAEVQLGLSPAFALAYKDKRYLSDFVDVLRTFDMNREVYEDFFIGLLIDKWHACDEVLFLLAARSGSISGQFGIEYLELPELDQQQKGTYLRYLLEDSLKSKVVHSDLLVDALKLLNIAIDFERFESLFENHRPVFDATSIPSLCPLE